MDSSDKPNPATQSKKQSISHIIQTDGTQSTPLLGRKKLGADFKTEASKPASKKVRVSSKATTEHSIPNDPSKADSDTAEHHALIGGPRGLQWSNNSCTFDAVLSILYNIWQDNAAERTVQFKDINNEYLGQIADGFSQTRH